MEGKKIQLLQKGGNLCWGQKIKGANHCCIVCFNDWREVNTHHDWQSSETPSFWFHANFKLPGKYQDNSKAWMQTGIMEEWLGWLDWKMCHQKLKILFFFLDNAPVRPNITLKNVKLQFFPAMLPSMDAGIIQTLKLEYKKKRKL